jgi:hypothetical protein
MAAEGGTADVDRTIDRIRKLLALAGSSNQHEAETAMRKAHELMLRHNIETTANRDGNYEVGHLGDPEKRVTGVESDVAGVLAEFFFVKVIRIPVFLPRLGKRGWVFEIVARGPTSRWRATSTRSCSRPRAAVADNLRDARAQWARSKRLSVRRDRRLSRLSRRRAQGAWAPA